MTIGERGPSKSSELQSEGFLMVSKGIENDEVDLDILDHALDSGQIKQSEHTQLHRKLTRRDELIKTAVTAGAIKIDEEKRQLENDKVTGLLKHELLIKRLTQLRKELNHPPLPLLENRPTKFQAIIVVVMDLDNLKTWNSLPEDKPSRETGDRALRALVDSVNAVIHDGGVMYRRGDQSDELIVILKVESEKTVTNDSLKEGLLARIEEAANAGSIEVEEKKLPVTASIAYEIIRPDLPDAPDDRTEEEILKEVDDRQNADKLLNPTSKAARIAAAEERLKAA